MNSIGRTQIRNLFVFGLTFLPGTIFGQNIPIWKSPTQGTVVSTPAVTEGGISISLSIMPPPSRGRSALSIRAARLDSGEVLWTRLQVFRKPLSIATSPAIANHVVVVAAGNLIVGIDIHTGGQMWKKRIAGEALTSPLVLENLGLVLIRSDQVLYAIESRSGKERWRYSNRAQKFQMTTRLFELGKNIWLGGGMSLDGNPAGVVLSLDKKTGEVRRQVQISDQAPHSISIPDRANAIFFTDGNSLGKFDLVTLKEAWPRFHITGVNIYSHILTNRGIVIWKKNRLWSVNPETGKEIWGATVGDKNSTLSFPPVALDGAFPKSLIYVATDFMHAWLLSAETGQPVWNYKCAYSLITRPIVVNGMMYSGSTRGLIAFRAPEITVSRSQIGGNSSAQIVWERLTIASRGVTQLLPWDGILMMQAIPALIRKSLPERVEVHTWLSNHSLPYIPGYEISMRRKNKVDIIECQYGPNPSPLAYYRLLYELHVLLDFIRRVGIPTVHSYLSDALVGGTASQSLKIMIRSDADRFVEAILQGQYGSKPVNQSRTQMMLAEIEASRPFWEQDIQQQSLEPNSAFSALIDSYKSRFRLTPPKRPHCRRLLAQIFDSLED